MDKNSQDWKDEVQYLTDTQNAVDSKVQNIEDNINNRREIVEEMKEQYTQRSHDLDTYEKQEVYQRIDDFMMFANSQLDLGEALKKAKIKPYFARIDFKEDEDKVKVYLGLRGIDDDKQIFVIDWRAPIGELFYEYGLGKAEFESPEGLVKGEVTTKRQYDINEGQLVDVYDVDINIFDEYLQKVLAKVNTDKLHNIASTIQKEQNEIIRDLKSDLVVVQGFVGSGKTTVALHRIAYMLYRLTSLKSTNILIFSLNEEFLRHISGVLPELGEQNTRTATFTKFVQRLLKITSGVESMDEFVTRFTGMDNKCRNIALKKLDYKMRDKIQKFLTKFNDELHFTHGFKLKKQEFTRVILNDLLQKEFGTLSPVERMKSIKNYICNLVNIKDDKLVNMINDELYVRLSSPIDFFTVYNKFMESNGLPICDFDAKIKYEDAVLLCTMRQLYTELLVKMDIKQIVIDEAQEYPLLFIDFLMRAFPHAQFSMFGDDNQCTTAGAMNSLKDLLNLNILYGDKKYYVLDKTYRSSEEIVEYANALIDAKHHNAFRLKVGFDVQELPLSNTVNQVSQQICEILEKVVPDKATIGIIVGDKEYAKNLYAELFKCMANRVGIVQDSHSSIDNQVQVVPVALSKGLEFDTAIVVLDGGLFESDFANHHKYIACTRAINKLFVLKK